MELANLIEGAVKLQASDIHLMEDYPPYFRVDSDLIPVKHPPITRDDMKSTLDILIPERLKHKLEEQRGVDISYQHKDIIRCRVIVFFERNKYKIVLRLIPMKPLTFEDLDLPDVLKKISDSRRGMVLVTGPTGCGKSTTLAAIVDYINSTRKISITTIEDPIEYVHQNKKAIVAQREVGDDVTSFNSGLIQALRQDPDVILVGEMRDMDTMRTAIKAAETGHLVFSTLHTNNATQTIERILGTFPQIEQSMIREQIGYNLRSVVTQNLARRIDGKGRVAALEILVVTDMIRKLILDNRIGDIPGVMKGGEEGMQTFDQGLANLVKANKITEEEGALYTHDVFAYKRFIKGVQSSSDRGGIILGFS